LVLGDSCPLHCYRRLQKTFNQTTEEEKAPKGLNIEHVYDRVKHLIASYEKVKLNTVDKNLWKKKSIFSDLSYWKSLLVRHYLDVMHIEKNVCDSIYDTLLNIPSKIKDNVKSRLDLIEMELPKQFAPKKRKHNIYLPPTCYILSRKEKNKIISVFCWN